MRSVGPRPARNASHSAHAAPHFNVIDLSMPSRLFHTILPLIESVLRDPTGSLEKTLGLTIFSTDMRMNNWERRSVTDTHVVHLSLSRRGKMPSSQASKCQDLAIRISHRRWEDLLL